MLVFSISGIAQTNGAIQGTVIDKNTEEPLAFAKILAEGTNFGAITDIDGNYKLDLPVGNYTIRVTYAGYQTFKKFNIPVNSGNIETVNFELMEANTDLETVEIVFESNKSAATTDMVTPLSVQKLTSVEIESNPGGNFDVSKVVQTLPGVGGSAGGAQRNDIIIRGGAHNENVYYLDGIEIPVLNHFQTQGSSSSTSRRTASLQRLKTKSTRS